MDCKLKNWLSKWEHLPAQGTKGWLDNRRYTVGGSELDRLLKDESEFVAQKAELTSIPQMLAMVWGSVFETVLRTLMSRIYHTEIWEASSIPSVEVQGKTYSMDGIARIRCLCNELNDNNYNYFMLLITLFEFKCPFSRIIVSGTIPECYIPQVKSGLADLAVPDMALYAEGVIRLCSMRQLKNNEEHNVDIHKPTGKKPLAMGVMVVYLEEMVEPPSACMWKWLKEPQDFGRLKSQFELNALLQAIKSGYYKVYHTPLALLGSEIVSRAPWFRAQKIRIPDEDPSKLIEVVKKMNHPGQFIGLIPYKIVDLNVVPVEKTVGYTKQFEGEIQAALDKVRQLTAIPDKAKRWEEYYKMYPHKAMKEIADNQTCGTDGIDSYF